MTRPARELLEFLNRYDPGIQALALGLREVVHQELAPWSWGAGRVRMGPWRMP